MDGIGRKLYLNMGKEKSMSRKKNWDARALNESQGDSFAMILPTWRKQLRARTLHFLSLVPSSHTLRPASELWQRLVLEPFVLPAKRWEGKGLILRFWWEKNDTFDASSEIERLACWLAPSSHSLQTHLKYHSHIRYRIYSLLGKGLQGPRALSSCVPVLL